MTKAQHQALATGIIDTDGDGRGEYAFFGELSGAMNVRKDETGGIGRRRITPPVLSGAFGMLRRGIVLRNGYCFRIFLPGKDAIARGEANHGGAKGVAIRADHAEKLWCGYAWPIVYGVRGRKAFFVDQSGSVLETSNANSRYSGVENGPHAGAARASTEEMQTRMTDLPALNTLGRDGNYWHAR